MNKREFIKKREGVFLITFLFISLFLISFVSSVSDPFRGGDIDIHYTSFDSIEQNKNHRFYFHTSNQTNILDNQTTTCDFDLFYQNGTEILDTDNLDFANNNEFNLLVLGGNFSYIGEYSVITECNTTKQTGGVSFNFDVTPSGQSGSENIVFIILITIIVYFVGFMGFFGKNEWVSALGGLGMMALSVYLINQGVIVYRDWFSNGLAYITLGLGAIFTLVPVLESISDNFNPRDT